MSAKPGLSYRCDSCGLLYEEGRDAPINPHFALCPRCGSFNEPHTATDGVTTWACDAPRRLDDAASA